MRRLLPLLPVFALAAACGPTTPTISSQQAKAFASVNAAANNLAAAGNTGTAAPSNVNVLPTTAATSIPTDNVLPTNGVFPTADTVLPTTGTVAPSAAGVLPTAAATASPSASAAPRATPAASAPGVTGAPVLEVVGDSYSSGVNGVGTGAKSWPAVLAKRLNWNYHVDATGTGFGSGYANKSTSGVNFGSRIDSVVAAHPTAIIIFGSRTDLYVSSSSVYDAASSFYAALHARLPTTPVIVVGPCWPLEYRPPLSSISTQMALVGAVRKAATDAKLPFVDPIGQRWFTSNNSSLIADGTHPTDEGMVHLADEMQRGVDLVAPTLLAPYSA